MAATAIGLDPTAAVPLDEEQREFRDFLDRLRAAKDRAEFDQFMNERRNRPPAPEPPPAASPAN